MRDNLQTSEELWEFARKNGLKAVAELLRKHVEDGQPDDFMPGYTSRAMCRIASRGFVIAKIWNWFLCPGLGAPEMDTVTGIGLFMIGNVLHMGITYHIGTIVKDQYNKTDFNKPLKRLSCVLPIPWIVLLCAWIVIKLF